MNKEKAKDKYERADIRKTAKKTIKAKTKNIKKQKSTLKSFDLKLLYLIF